jgi:choline dehydrogenase-like flavoprotein
VTEFDYVIIGAGSAGCVLADRLTEDGTRTVCLVEAGKPDRSPLIKMPLGLMWLMRGKRWNWAFETSPQEHLDNRKLPVPRGKALGGSSTINGMIYIRGHRTDYDNWRDMGCSGWGYDDVLPWFRKSERNGRLGADPLHGGEGPLHVSDNQDPHPLDRRFFDAGQSLQIRGNDDFNGGQQEGLGMYQTTTLNGRRWSAADAFLRPAMSRPNLKVMSASNVSRIVIANGRATGVALDGQTVAARGEVILAAGAIASPQLLQLSGIGDPALLGAVGIKPVLENPSVGANLHDHPNVMLMRELLNSESYGLSLIGIPRVVAAAFDYVLRGRGMFASNVVEAGGFARTRRDVAAPDVQFHFVPFHRSTRPDRIVTWGHGFALHVCVLRPTSRGRVDIESPDPHAPPRIDPQMMATQDDRATLIAGMRLARLIMQSPALAEISGPELIPGDGVQSDEEILGFIRAKCSTVFHPVGTCRMGSDSSAVVDTRLRLKGIERLRVVDASVMPQIVSGNTNAATIMIAERGAAFIGEDARA